MNSSQEQAETPRDTSEKCWKTFQRKYQALEKIQCRQLAHTLSTTLPRELRNHVYTYLICGRILPDQPNLSGCILVCDNAFPPTANGSGDAAEDAWQADQFGWLRKDCTKYEQVLLRRRDSSEYRQHRECIRHHLGGHVFDPEYVGETVVREAVEWRYTASTFYVHRQNPGRGLYRLFTWMDRRFDVVPHSLIRHLCVDINLRDFSPLTRWSLRKTQNEGRKLNYLHRMLMKSFDLVERKERLHVRFILMCNFTPHDDDGARCQNEWSVLNVLEALREPVYTLVHAGARVVFQYRDERDVVLDRTGIFHLSRAEWQKERDDHVQQWNEYRPDMHYITRQGEVERDGIPYQVEIQEMLAQIEACRRRWGHDSWWALVGDKPQELTVQ